MTVSGGDRFPDIAIPSILPLPSAPDTPDEAVEYLKTLHEVIRSQQVRLARALQVLSSYRVVQIGDTDAVNGYEALPRPTGSGATVVDVFRQAIYFDPKLVRNGQVPQWVDLTARSPLGTDKVSEPLVVRGSGPPEVDLGDDVVVQNEPHDPATVSGQMNQLLWDRETGDIVSAVVVK